MTKNKSRITEPTADQTIEPGADEKIGANALTDAGTESAGSPATSELQARIESLEDALLRAKADYQNFQRRATTERIDAVRYANAELMRSLLNAMDDFDRTLAASNDATLDAIVAGVRLVYENLQKALTDNGLEIIEAKGKPFDPAIHQALMQQPSDEHAPGTVIEQVTRGYRLRDRVLRPARVVVAKAPDNGTKTQEEETSS
ncbi:MAG: nucleotide exchange factor GrpE [Phycisphaerales bacterium]|nr:nucleotide exchange factor GrpE [Phycisphaerales bacterium]